jgi:hypothetical protein
MLLGASGIPLRTCNIDTVVIASTAGLPVNWGSGTLYMDNVVINNSVAVPARAVGAGLPGLIAACGGFLGWWRRRQNIA